MLLFSSALLLTPLQAAELNASPKRCIALNQGQICYQSLQLNWQVQVEGRYCIRVAGDKKSLQCWDNLKQGRFNYELESKTDQTFELVNQAGDVVAITQVKVSWVYKNRTKRQSTWRLF